MKGTSKLPSRHLSADRPLQRLRGCFLGDNAPVPPAYRVKVQKCASFVDILDVCKFTTFCDRKRFLNLLNKRKISRFPALRFAHAPLKNRHCPGYKGQATFSRLIRMRIINYLSCEEILLFKIKSDMKIKK